MTLTLTRTRLDRRTSAEDYTVRDDGEPVGRLYKVHAPARPELAWSWSITVYVDPRAEVTTSGTVADFADAKASFRTSWRKWLAWKAKTEIG
jgi:hypothetical protein